MQWLVLACALMQRPGLCRWFSLRAYGVVCHCIKDDNARCHARLPQKSCSRCFEYHRRKQPTVVVSLLRIMIELLDSRQNPLERSARNPERATQHMLNATPLLLRANFVSSMNVLIALYSSRTCNFWEGTPVAVPYIPSACGSTSIPAFYGKAQALQSDVQALGSSEQRITCNSMVHGRVHGVRGCACTQSECSVRSR